MVRSVTAIQDEDRGKSLLMVEEETTDGSRFLLKEEVEFEAEQMLGRKLLPEERAVRSGATGVEIVRSRFPIAWNEIEARPSYGLAENEIWVTSDGRLISLRTKKILKQNRINGYVGVVTKIGGRDGRNAVVKTHIAVAKAFIPNPENKPEVNHRDGIKTHSFQENLEWATASENSEHAYSTGLARALQGDERADAKLTAGQVNQLREERISGEATWSIRQKARELGICHTNLAKAIRGEAYKNA